MQNSQYTRIVYTITKAIENFAFLSRLKWQRILRQTMQSLQNA